MSLLTWEVSCLSSGKELVLNIELQESTIAMEAVVVTAKAR